MTCPRQVAQEVRQGCILAMNLHKPRQSVTTRPIAGPTGDDEVCLAAV